MKTALITGADGFIGSHLTELLLSRDYKVRALAQYNSFNSWGWLDVIPANPNLEVITGDVRDPYFVKKSMEGTDIVFHLAALIAIPYSYLAPDCYVETNVKGTLNICQAAKELGGIRVLITSTSEVYGTAKYVPIDEKHPKQAQSPYSASKIAADAIAMSFYNSFSLPVTIVRPFNTFGPRQSARAIVPTIIIQIASGAKEIVLGNLTPTRDMNYVTDTCRGILGISETEVTIGKEINVSSNYEISMGEIFNMIREIMKSDVQLIINKERVRPDSSEVFRLWGDNSLIRQLTGFVPEYDIRKGLELTCKWFGQKQNILKYKPGVYNI